MNTKDLLKSKGILLQKEKEYCSIRILSDGGNFTADKMAVLTNISKIYGKGYLTLTSRLSIEIPFIKKEDLNKVKNILEENKLELGGTGKTVHPITCCRGTVCRNGIIDTQGLAENLQKNILKEFLPNKVTIGIIGCSNNCLKSQNNDIYIQPYKIINPKNNKCVLCNKCIDFCKQNALSINENNNIVLNKNLCNNCGKCTLKCPLNDISIEKTYYKIYLKESTDKNNFSYKAINTIVEKENLIDEINRILYLYMNEGMDKEKFPDMIKRIGIENI